MGRIIIALSTHPPLNPELLIAAYCQGAFPMARSRESAVIDWYRPDPRAVLPLEGFQCPRSLRQAVRRGEFEIRCDTAFERVVRACAQPRNTQRQTWINEPIVRAYTGLHRMGLAHCVEAWRGRQLVGGLYGVTLGGAFFGESMFHDPAAGGTDASKICLVHLVQRLRERGFTLLDVQINSDHMRRFGVVEIPLDQYMQQLANALEQDVEW